MVARDSTRREFGALSDVSPAPFLGFMSEAAQRRGDFVRWGEFGEFGEARDQRSAGFDVAAGFGEGSRFGVRIALAAGDQQERNGEEPKRCRCHEVKDVLRDGGIQDGPKGVMEIGQLN